MGNDHHHDPPPRPTPTRLNPLFTRLLVTVAALSSVVPYALELIVLHHLPTRVFGVLMSLQPAAAAIAGLLILHQHLEPAPIAALVLVTVASIGVTRHSFREPLPTTRSSRPTR
jgi:inner membrane transporter RhtA